MKAAIVGVTGYTGVELVRLIHKHPILELGTLHSYSNHSESVIDFFPQLQGIIQQPVLPFDEQQIMTDNELVFFATPSGITKNLAAPFVEAQFPVIDLSGDLRLKDPEVYRTWYKATPAKTTLLEQADYCLPELFPPKKGQLISNPGCYATVAQLLLAPLLETGWVDVSSIVLDGKSGLSGAGKKVSEASHYVNVNSNMSMYKVNQHQHIPEMLQQLQLIDPQLQTLQFTTSLIPVNRGIFMSGYVKADAEISETELQQLFETFYENKPFVRVQPTGTLPDLHQVVGSNYCDIGLCINPDNRWITLVGVIDNLVKGAAGQAIQNFNCWAGIAETSGLVDIPLYL